MNEQQKRILEAVKHCEEVIRDNEECEKCRDEHQNLKECLELVFEVLPILDVIPLDDLKKLVNL